MPGWVPRIFLSCALATGLALGAPTVGAAAIRDYPLTSADAGLSSLYWERAIVSWRGGLWFTERNVNKLGRIGVDGRITETALPEQFGEPGNGPQSLAVGAEGLYFLTDSGDVVGLLQADGRLGSFAVPTFTGARTIAAAPGPGVWLTDFVGEGLIRAAPDGGQFYPIEFESPAAITAGPDGAMWLGDEGALQRVTDAGAARAFPLPGPCKPSVGCALPDVTSMVTGPDKALWYTRSGQRTIPRGPFEGLNRSSATVGRTSTQGRTKEWELPSELAPTSVVVGPDRGLWFATADGLGRVSTRGRVRLVELPGGRRADSIAFGPDGAAWFTDEKLNRISRITIRDAMALAGPEIRSRSLRLRRQRVGVVLACPKGRGTCRGRVSIGTDETRVARGRYRIRAGRSKVVRTKATKAGNRLLRRRKQVRATVVVSQRGGRDGDTRELRLRR